MAFKKVKCEICGKEFDVRWGVTRHVCYDCEQKAKLGERLFNVWKESSQYRNGDWVDIDQILDVKCGYIKHDADEGKVDCLIYRLVRVLTDLTDKPGFIPKSIHNVVKNLISLVNSIIEKRYLEGRIIGKNVLEAVNRGSASLSELNTEKEEWEIKRQKEFIEREINEFLEYIKGGKKYG